jgi:hypothetical protein
MNEPSPPDATTPPRVLSGGKRLLGLAALLGVIIVCGSLGLMMRSEPVPEADAPSLLSSVAYLLFAAAAAVLGLAVYGVAFATRCLTFRLDRPFFPAYRWKAWVFKLAYELLLQVAFAFACAPTVFALLYGRLPGQVVALVGLGAPFVLAQFVMTWLTTTGPIDRAVIARRMAALGFGPDRLPGGLPMGVSNPDRSSFKKFPLIEEDLGMLWLTSTHLSFRGDATAWDFPRADVLAVERKADAGATSSYFGAVQVILRVRQSDGVERRVRLHPQGGFTQSAHAAALNTLADRLESWRRIDPSSAPP